MVDILETKNLVKEVKVLDKGYVKLIDVMPRLVPQGRTADFSICTAARMSTGGEMKSEEEDTKLIQYLWRNEHTSPFEMIELKWEMKIPIFIARQWIRHRTANVNEYSGRYSQILNDYYIPNEEQIKGQSKINHQGSDGELDENIIFSFRGSLDTFCAQAYQRYEEALESGVSRETARLFLPVNYYTKWVWKNDLHNTLKFLALRMDDHAQWEIRQYAYEMWWMLKLIVPETINAFETWTLSRKQVVGLMEWFDRKTEEDILKN